MDDKLDDLYSYESIMITIGEYITKKGIDMDARELFMTLIAQDYIIAYFVADPKSIHYKITKPIDVWPKLDSVQYNQILIK